MVSPLPQSYISRLMSIAVLAVCLCKHSTFGFGLSATPVGLSPGGLQIAHDGSWVTSHGSGRENGVFGGATRQPKRPREQHLITCKVVPPRKYGSADWLTNMINLPKSRLLYNIRHHLMVNTGFAFLISLAHALTPQHIIDDLHVSPIPHSIMAGALGLLLVFRTNAAYNRFWEARKVWGTVVNTCRNIARLGAVSLGPNSEEWAELAEYVKIFPFLLKQHLQNDRNDTELSFSNLPPASFYSLQEDPNPPLLACQRMSEVVSRAYGEGSASQSLGGSMLDFTSVTYRMEIEHCLSLLIDCLGMCERILTTPVPRGYSRHTSRFLTVYGLTLPVVLVPHTELFTAPVVCAVCWGLFSIEEIAYFIEQPFDPDYKQLDLPAYSEKIRRDVDRMTRSSGIQKRSRSSAKAGMHGWIGEPGLSTAFWPGPNGARRMTVNAAGSGIVHARPPTSGSSPAWIAGGGRGGFGDGNKERKKVEVGRGAGATRRPSHSGPEIGASLSRRVEDDVIG